MLPDFSTKDVETLAKRAALRCSNPDCHKLTTGPHSDEAKAVSIGQAAHIFGARPGAARYREEMTDIERGAISNGIWLCSDCHGLVDKDDARHPVPLLLLWKNEHEARNMKELGKPGELLRQQLIEEKLRPFSHLPPHVRQVLREKPDYWEYTLTAELLDFYFRQPLRRARDLEQGLVLRPMAMMPGERFVSWASIKMEELTRAVQAINMLLNELQRVWDAPGDAGDEHEIDHACRLFGQCAEHFVLLAEEAKFTSLPRGFEDFGNLLAQGSLFPLRRFPELPDFIRSVFASENPKGTYHHMLVIEMPPGWQEASSAALQKGLRAFEDRGGVW